MHNEFSFPFINVFVRVYVIYYIHNNEVACMNINETNVYEEENNACTCFIHFLSMLRTLILS